MIKAIIFDFDGVILESTKQKTEAFRQLFLDYPDHLEKILDYHVVNGGISRYVKFRHIYKHILQEPLPREKEDELSRRFTKEALQKVLDAPFVPGAEEFLKGHRNRYQFFVASGTPEEELHQITSQRDLTGLFNGIYGSPSTKYEIIRRIHDEFDLTSSDCVFVGDAHSDRLAAQEADIPFVFRVHEGDPYKEQDRWFLKDLTGLPGCLEDIETETSRLQE